MKYALIIGMLVFGMNAMASRGNSAWDPDVARLRDAFSKGRTPTAAELTFGKEWACRDYGAYSTRKEITDGTFTFTTTAGPDHIYLNYSYPLTVETTGLTYYTEVKGDDGRIYDVLMTFRMDPAGHLVYEFGWKVPWYDIFQGLVEDRSVMNPDYFADSYGACEIIK